MLKIKKTSRKSKARAGVINTVHGKIATPFFMPIATVGAVKFLSSEDLETLNASIILSNTYHLYLRPGDQLIKKFGGLHKFMAWPKPILTDSGGYQVFSLAGNKGKGEALVKISAQGVEFRSHIDGSKHFFTPEKSIQIQQNLGVDIMMNFDVCPPSKAPIAEIEKAVSMTTEWAARCYKQWQSVGASKKNQQLFAIVQGGTVKELRIKSAQELTKYNFSGFAIGGLAVGEARAEMYSVLKYITDYLPTDKPRYLMGVGKPEEIVTAVQQGVDMFDCVIPTREARHGRLYQFCTKATAGSIHLFGNVHYRTITITNAKFQSDKTPINKDSANKLLHVYSKAYLFHLLKIGEGLGLRLATLNNVEFYLGLMERIRKAIAAGKL
jgi:queuine tRNA-ribosyltransferase